HFSLARRPRTCATLPSPTPFRSSAAAEIKIIAPAELQDLRELPGVAESVGLPADARLLAFESLAEIALAVKEVPGVRFGRDHVLDRKSTRLNSSHQIISYAVFCL